MQLAALSIFFIFGAITESSITNAQTMKRKKVASVEPDNSRTLVYDAKQGLYFTGNDDLCTKGALRVDLSYGHGGAYGSIGSYMITYLGESGITARRNLVKCTTADGYVYYLKKKVASQNVNREVYQVFLETFPKISTYRQCDFQRGQTAT